MSLAELSHPGRRALSTFRLIRSRVEGFYNGIVRLPFPGGCYLRINEAPGWHLFTLA